MIRRGRLVLALLCLIGPGSSAAMTVEQAYRAIPHERTVFDVGAATMEAEERTFLERFFDLIDQAIVARVERMQALPSRGAPSDRYDELLQHFGAMPVPVRLRHVHQLVIDAVKEQRASLDEWRRSGATSDIRRHPRVQRASQKLHAAYGELMQLFPREGAHNQQAFYDYLCALDFI